MKIEIENMKKDAPLESFGVFKPVGHVVMAFAALEDQQAASRALKEAGFVDEDVLHYSADEMKAQVDHDMANAGMLSSLGQDLNLAKAHRQMAEQGHSWIVVFSPTTELTDRVTTVARRCNAALAQKYGQMVIEELI